MASRVERQSSITLGGVGAMGGAIALCLIGLGQFTRAEPTPSALLFVGWAVAVGLIIVLCRVRLPHSLRFGCIIATLGVMFLLAAKSDMFAMKHIAKKVGDPTSSSSTERESIEGGAPVDRSQAPMGHAGASLQLRPSADGDLGWASALQQQIGAGIGGSDAGWLNIDGSVRARKSDGQTSVMIGWTIAGLGAPVNCGVTSVTGSDDHIIASEVRVAFETAATRSVQKREPACF